MLPTIEISSIIIAFSSHSDNLICVLFWSDIVDRTSPVLLGIANAVLMFVPAMFIAATPVDAASKTVGFLACVQPPLTSKKSDFFEVRGGCTQAIGFPGFIGACLQVFTTVW